MSWLPHLASTEDLPKQGTQKAVCGSEVKGAVLIYSDAIYPACKKCAEIEKGSTIGQRRYFAYLIEGEKFKQSESEG